MKKTNLIIGIIILAITFNFSFCAPLLAKSKKLENIIKIFKDSGLKEKLLENGKILTKVNKIKSKIDKFTNKYAPEMRGRKLKELVQYFMGKKFLMKVLNEKLLVKMNGKLYDYNIRIDIFQDKNGKIRHEIRPVLEAKNPPNVSPIDEKEIKFDMPKWYGSGTMVLTNLSILKAKHPKNFNKIVALLNNFGPVIDSSSVGRNWRAIDNLVEQRFDRKKYNSLFIFGGSDVIPFGEFKNPVKNIRPMDLDRIVYSDDYYGDFDHDRFNNWEIMVTRLPDDNGILQNPESILYRKVPIGNKPKFRNFVVYGNQNWKVADRISQLGDGELKYSSPLSENSFNPSYFRGRNVVLTLHGARGDGSRYWGEYPKGAGQYRGRTLPAMNLSEAVAPDSIILSGCCYGAYISGRNNNSDNRMALRFLRNGARAYIGNTGIGWIGGTTSRTTGLWARLYIKYVRAGYSPQKAFFMAKRAYATEAGDPYNFKMLHQYIYLGLPPVNSGKSKIGSRIKTPEIKPVAHKKVVKKKVELQKSTNFNSRRGFKRRWK